MTIDVVIPNYNGSNLVEKNLPILVEVLGKYNVGEVIIVDDFSKKEDFLNLENFITKEQAKTKIKLKILRNEKNYGFSSTVNNGVNVAKSDLVLLLNTDVIVKKDFLDYSVKDFDVDKNLFGVGCMDKSVEDVVVLRGRGVASWQKGFLIHSRGEVDKSDTFWVSGGSSLVRRDLFEKFGGFDIIYNPFYWEDIDLSYRARKAGYSVLFEPKSIVEHRHKEGAIKKHYNDSKIKTIAYRNQFIFVWKNVTDVSLIVAHIIWLPYHVLAALKRRDWAFFSGLFLAVLRLPAIIERRKIQSKYYKIKDKEIV